ncbi:MAG: nucleotidyltransferase family protein [Chloroflexi bacterium]|nr:nucleotidyltransferase family protein [Chloroflexota bacterium]
MTAKPRFTDPIRSADLQDICEGNGITYLALFGSYARGEATPGSDVDLLVRFSQPKGLIALVKIQRELSEKLGRPVDLVTEASLSPYLRNRIKAQLRPIYERT